MRDHGNEPNDAVELTSREAAFAARLGTALRTDAAAPEDFDARLMRIIESGGDVTSRPPLRLEQGRPWWTRKRPIAISPLGGIALAAGFAGIVALGTIGAVRSGAIATPATTVAMARVDTVHLVRFVIQRPGAQQVALAGDFNGWSTDAIPLELAPDGASWTVTVPLAPGRYEYAFVVDGRTWVSDPAALAVHDEFGGEASVLRLPGRGERAM